MVLTTSLILGMSILSWILFAGWTAMASAVLGGTMALIAVEDARRLTIPDVLSLPAIPAGLMATIFVSSQASVLSHTGAALAAAGVLYAVRTIYERIRGVEGLGLGDIKLGAVAGAWSGFNGLGPIFLTACFTAIVYVGILKLRDPKTLNRETKIPFGVFLAPSIWLIWALERL